MSIISAGTTTTTALVQTGDTTGSLVLKTGSTPTTAMTINSSQIVNFANAPTVGGAPLPSGAMTLISTQTASNSANISWTGLSGYDKYLLIYENIVAATSGTALYMYFGYGSTPTYYLSAYYSGNNIVTGSASVVYNNDNFSRLYLAGRNSNINNAAPGVSGNCFFQGFLSGNYATFEANTFYINNGSASQLETSGGMQTGSTAATTAIKIQISSGNITSGTASLYGISS